MLIITSPVKKHLTKVRFSLSPSFGYCATYNAGPCSSCKFQVELEFCIFLPHIIDNTPTGTVNKALKTEISLCSISGKKKRIVFLMFW